MSPQDLEFDIAELRRLAQRADAMHIDGLPDPEFDEWPIDMPNVESFEIEFVEFVDGE